MGTTQAPADVMAALGLEVTSEFVPFSQSRNRGEKSPSLNWRVTLHKGGREVLTTDYMAGCGHCPSYRPSVYQSSDSAIATRWECENGRKANMRYSLGVVGGGKPILPNPVDVLYSLVSDSDVLDYGSFEDWAECFGYDTDSRKAEAIWKSCIEMALKLRGAIGDVGLSQLREAFQDY